MIDYRVGQVLRFKAGRAQARYGATATIVAIGDVVDRSHPGRVVTTWVDLRTETGVDIQWPQAQVTRYFIKGEAK